MTSPRSQIAPPGEFGCFHVVSRCVRRAFLCGTDQFSGRCFEHRRQWIQDRIHLLAESFAVSVYSYAVMSNHFHIVLSIDPGAVLDWSDDEIVNRWLRVFPGALAQVHSDRQRDWIRQGYLGTPERLKDIRERLGSLSWFMRALNEPIARMANREDGCTSRFWEGRFKCQALLEPQAIVSAMAYVDLNPARAKMAETLEESHHTSIKIRLSEKKDSPPGGSDDIGQPLKPIAGLDAEQLLELTEKSYIELVQWTGEQPHPSKRGRLRATEGSQQVPAALWSVSNHPQRWLRQVQGTESRYFRAIGSAEALMAKAAELGQRWMQGVCGERASMILRSQTE